MVQHDNAGITVEQLLAAYANGYFPMADARDESELHWYHPERRGIIPLDAFHIPASLAKFMRRNLYEVKADTAFESVIRACADTPRDGQGTWINDAIIDMYCQLYRRGFAHSMECWYEGKLVGGLYGISLGGAFFGESMFSRAENASKVALVHLVRRLKSGGYQLLDTQYVNDHLKQFGVAEIAREEYLQRLAQALPISAVF